MPEARVSFNRTALGDVTENYWNNFTSDSLSSYVLDPLVDYADNSDTGWDLSGSPSGGPCNTTGSGWTGTVGVSWVDVASGPEPADDSIYIGASATATININGLDNAKTYQIDVYGALDSGGGNYTSVSVNASEVDSEKDVGGAEQTWTATGVSPSSGTITITATRGASATSNAHINAFRILEESGGGASGQLLSQINCNGGF